MFSWVWVVTLFVFVGWLWEQIHPLAALAVLVIVFALVATRWHPGVWR